MQIPNRLIKSKTDLLTVVGFSANKKALSDLEKVFFKSGNYCYFFYENFLYTPLTNNDIVKNDEIISSAPFLKKYIELDDIKFIPDIDKIKELERITEDLNFDYLIKNPPFVSKSLKSLKKIAKENLQKVNLLGVGAEIFGKKLIEFWKDKNKSNHNKDFPHCKTYISKNKEIVGYHGYFDIEFLKDEYLKTIQKSQNFIPLMIEYLVSDFKFVLSGVKKVSYLCLSISTENFFYGYVWFFYTNDIKIEATIRTETEKKIVEQYIPVLTIFENAWVEKELKESISKGFVIEWTEENKSEIKIKTNDNNYILPIVFLKNIKENKPGNELELAFRKVWQKRFEILKKYSDRNKVWEDEINKTLVFNKFFISSPIMINNLKKISILNPKKDKDKDFLPSALVIGGPGAGKDSISKLIQLFSDEYFESSIYTINVASLKPSPLAPSLTLGTEFMMNEFMMNYPNKNKKINQLNLSLMGLFEKILNKEKSKIDRMINEITENDLPLKNDLHFFKMKGKIGRKIEDLNKKSELNKLKKFLLENIENIPIKVVIVLDELNSLDMDTQGALLRLLENSELVPIGGITPVEKNERIGFMVIGTMNEDPDRLTKEPVLKDIFERKNIFGGLIGEILYEHFRKVRRLRDDLYYRLIRGGKIVLPSLNDRIEDIPILFYFFCKTEVESKGFKLLYIPLDVLTEVSAPNHDWHGNVRQLQTLAKIVVDISVQDKKDSDDMIIISKDHLNKGFKEI